MSKSPKSTLFERLFEVYSRNLVRRRFSSVRICDFDVLSRRETSLPLIVYGNHSSWWDGIIIFQILRTAGLDGYFLMEDVHLAKYRLFRRLGAIPVSRTDPRLARRNLESAAGILQCTERSAMVIFPQGEILPRTARPIRFQSGISRLIELTGACQTISLAIQIEFGADFKPVIFVRCGELRTFPDGPQSNPRELANELAGELTQNLDTLSADISDGLVSGFIPLF